MMMQRSFQVLAVLALLLESNVLSFAPPFPAGAVGICHHRCASSVQTLSDESAATEQTPEGAISEESVAFEVAPVVIEEDAPTVGSDAEASVVAEASEPTTPKRKVERERHTAFVGNLSYGTGYLNTNLTFSLTLDTFFTTETTEATIRDLFAAYGTVQLVNLPKDRITGSPRGFAFVDMATNAELESAIQALNESTLGDRELRVQRSEPQDNVRAPKKEFPAGQKLYVGNVPFDITKDEVKEFFGQYGEIVDVFIPMSEGQGRGFLFITVKAEDAEKIIEETNDFEFEGRNIVVNKPLPPGQKAVRSNTRKKIYIGNLSFDTIAETIESLFAEFGEVYDCFMPTDVDTGNSRGFGFVTMAADAADMAINELDGCEVDGRVIRVNAAMVKKDNPYTMKTNDAPDDYA